VEVLKPLLKSDGAHDRSFRCGLFLLLT
jgi:hypothetical protein